jgi:hypothetical protein
MKTLLFPSSCCTFPDIFSVLKDSDCSKMMMFSMTWRLRFIGVRLGIRLWICCLDSQFRSRYGVQRLNPVHCSVVLVCDSGTKAWRISLRNHCPSRRIATSDTRGDSLTFEMKVSKIRLSWFFPFFPVIPASCAVSDWYLADTCHLDLSPFEVLLVIRILSSF